MAGAHTQAFTDATFDAEVLQSDLPVLVDFWAEWCPPCRHIGPVVDALAAEYAGKAKIGKLDVDHNRETVGRFRVGSIPTLLVFKGGQIVDQRIGSASKSDIEKLLTAHL